MTQVTKNWQDMSQQNVSAWNIQKAVPQAKKWSHLSPSSSLSFLSYTDDFTVLSLTCNMSKKLNCFLSWLPVNSEVTTCISFVKCPFLYIVVLQGNSCSLVYIWPRFRLLLVPVQLIAAYIKPSSSVRHHICSPCSWSTLMKRPLLHSFGLHSSCLCSK